MTTEFNNATFPAEDLPSESADRGAPARRQLTKSAKQQPALVNQPRRLRRWSVAELIARAVPQPPAGSVAY